MGNTQIISEEEYNACCDRFRFGVMNASEAVEKYDIPLAQYRFNSDIRPELLKLLWCKGRIMSGEAVPANETGENLEKWLGKHDYELFLETYCSSIAGEMRRSLKIMCELFEETAGYIASELGYEIERSRI